MRILLINHFPLIGSGSGVYTKNLAEYLVKKGNEVCIIMPENELVSNYYKNIKLHPIYFTFKNDISNALPFNFPCFTTHPRSNQTFYSLNDKQYNDYKRVFKNAIEEEIKIFKPDIIHCGHIWTISSIATNYNIPVVITTHGTDLIGYNMDYRFKKDADEAYIKASKIITISNNNKSIVKKIFKNDSKCVLIPNGYDSEIFYKYNYDKELVLSKIGVNKIYDKMVCFVGKFTYIKGIDILLNACKFYENNDTLTVLAGDGEIFYELKELSNKLKLKNVIFLGNQDQNLLREIYNISSVAIVPSRSEAFGLVVIEALACGTPVIGTNVGGIPDIINDDIGVLFEKDDYKQLATYVEKVLNKKIRFDEYYISNYISDKYSLNKLIDKIIKVYKDLIK